MTRITPSGRGPLLLLLAAAHGGCAVPDGEPAAAVFDRSKLHKVEITVDESYLAQLSTDLDNRVPCTVRYDGELLDGAGVRQKGNTLIDLSEKPSFSIKFDEFEEKANLYGLDKLLLNSSVQDSTFLRAQIGADMYARAGLPAARIAHAVVSLNGSDQGLYVVAEAIDKAFLQNHFGANNADGNLYEGSCCGDFADDVGHMDLKNEEKDQRTNDDLGALADVILNAPDAEFAGAVAEHLDLDRFITHYALEALLGHWDGYSYRANNYYMYDNPSDGRFVFIPHGMDRILEDPSFDPEALPVARLPLRIRSLPAFDDRFHAEMARVVGAAWDEGAIFAAIDQAAELFDAAGTGEQTRKDVTAFEANVDALRGTLSQRRDVIKP